MEMTHESFGDRPQDILAFEMSKEEGCVSFMVGEVDGIGVVVLGVGHSESVLLPHEADMLADQLRETAQMARTKAAGRQPRKGKR